jgi:PAS domain S-box-containing protein
MAEKPTYEQLEKRILELDKESAMFSHKGKTQHLDENSFSQLFQWAPIPMAYATEKDGYVGTTWNANWYKTFGYPEDMAHGRSGHEIGLWVRSQDRHRLIEMANQQNYVTDFEVVLRCHDGSLRHCSLSGRFIDNPGSRLLMVVYQDITERKQAEEEKARLEEAFHKEKETLAMILQRTPHGISLVDNDGKYVYLNPYYTKITGYTLEDIPSKQEWFKKAYPDENYRRKIIEAWNKDTLEGELGKIREFKIKCKNGDTKHIEFRSAFLEDKKISVLTDITSRKESEKVVREKDRLQGVLEVSGAVCHEMNQPLMSALGYFDLIMLDMPEDDANYPRICKIQTQLERISDITKKLMKISRYQTRDYLDGKIYDFGTPKPKY